MATNKRKKQNEDTKHPKPLYARKTSVVQWSSGDNPKSALANSCALAKEYLGECGPQAILRMAWTYEQGSAIETNRPRGAAIKTMLGEYLKRSQALKRMHHGGPATGLESLDDETYQLLKKAGRKRDKPFDDFQKKLKSILAEQQRFCIEACRILDNEPKRYSSKHTNNGPLSQLASDLRNAFEEAGKSPTPRSEARKQYQNLLRALVSDLVGSEPNNLATIVSGALRNVQKKKKTSGKGRTGK